MTMNNPVFHLQNLGFSYLMGANCLSVSVADLMPQYAKICQRSWSIGDYYGLLVITKIINQETVLVLSGVSPLMTPWL